MGWLERLIEWFKGLFQRRLPDIPTSADDLADSAADSAVDGASDAASYTAYRTATEGKVPDASHVVRSAGVPTNKQELALEAGVPASSHEAKHLLGEGVMEAAGVPEVDVGLDAETEMALDDAAYHAGHLSRGGAQPPAAPPEGEPPCTFEQYVDATSAQSAWAQQGKDMNAGLQEHFGIDSVGFGAWASYWGAMMAADPDTAMRFAELQSASMAKWQA